MDLLENEKMDGLEINAMRSTIYLIVHTIVPFSVEDILHCQRLSLDRIETTEEPFKKIFVVPFLSFTNETSNVCFIVNSLQYKPL